MNVSRGQVNYRTPTPTTSLTPAHDLPPSRCGYTDYYSSHYLLLELYLHHRVQVDLHQGRTHHVVVT
jgi:hypothetical protein